MQRKVLLAVLAALALLGGCAHKDPNLAVHSLGEYSRPAGDYTLNLKTYGLDADGRAQLAGQNDPSLSGFVARTLAAKGYVQKASGPAAFGLEVHLVCGDMRTASLGFIDEALGLPAQAVPGYLEQVHFWLPESDLDPVVQQSREDRDRRERGPYGRDFGGGMRQSQSALSGAPFGGQKADSCQGRVLVVLNPAQAGAVRQVYVGRAATGDCAYAKNCPTDACRTALEQALVELLDKSL
jgi:hypothetical protein